MRPFYIQGKINWQNGNTGLWYDKFCDQWTPNWLCLGDGGKKNWIETVTGEVGNKPQLETANERRANFLNAHDQQSLFFKNTYTFVTGLGREHPVENGFAWHHTLGVPYLPGSSIKGMVRAWAEQWEKLEPDDEEIKRIFGPKNQDARDNPHVGSVIFLDALPSQPVKLQADIMTPHYSDYYAGKTDNNDDKLIPPADWHSPIPIPFLAVSVGQSFMFGLLPRRKEDKDDCQRVETWLKDALSWIGAGAKTAVGYGRFEPDPESTQQLQAVMEQRHQEEQAQQAEAERQATLKKQTQGKSELYTKLFLISQNDGWQKNKEAFVQEGLIESWLDKLEADPQADAIQYLAELIKRHFSELLENPEAKKGKKNKFMFKPRQRTFALRVLKLVEGKLPNMDSSSGKSITKEALL